MFNFNNKNNFNYNGMMNSPMFKMLQSQGISYEQMVKQICQQRGLDINQVLEQAKTLMKNNDNNK